MGIKVRLRIVPAVSADAGAVTAINTIIDGRVKYAVTAIIRIRIIATGLKRKERRAAHNSQRQVFAAVAASPAPRSPGD
jgi:hypothetical protein